MSPGTSRMTTKVRTATPTSVGIMSRSRPTMYRLTVGTRAAYAALGCLACALRARRSSVGRPLSQSLLLLCEPDPGEVLVRVVVRADAPATDDVEVRDDPVPPVARVLVGLLVHRVLLDVRHELHALGRVGLAALSVDHRVELVVVVEREVEALAGLARRPELGELKVRLVEEVAVEVERDLEVARAKVGLIRRGLLHVVRRGDADLLPLVDEEDGHRLVRRGDGPV